MRASVRTLAVALALTLLSTLAPPLVAAEGWSAVGIQVRQGRRPAPGIEVRLRPDGPTLAEPGALVSGVTDEEGRAVIYVPPGVWRLELVTGDRLAYFVSVRVTPGRRAEELGSPARDVDAPDLRWRYFAVDEPPPVELAAPVRAPRTAEPPRAAPPPPVAEDRAVEVAPSPSPAAPPATPPATPAPGERDSEPPPVEAEPPMPAPEPPAAEAPSAEPAPDEAPAVEPAAPAPPELPAVDAAAPPPVEPATEEPAAVEPEPVDPTPSDSSPFDSMAPQPSPYDPAPPPPEAAPAVEPIPPPAPPAGDEDPVTGTPAPPTPPPAGAEVESTAPPAATPPQEETAAAPQPVVAPPADPPPVDQPAPTPEREPMPLPPTPVIDAQVPELPETLPVPSAPSQPPLVAPDAPPVPPPAAEPELPPAPPRFAATAAGECPDCRDDEAVAVVERTVVPGGDACAGEVAAAALAAGRQLGGRATGPQALEGGSVAPWTGGTGCQLLGVVLPAGATYRGYRYEVEGGSGAGRCYAGSECPVADAVWPERPTIRELDGGATLVYGLFRNASQDRARRARLTVYYLP